MKPTCANGGTNRANGGTNASFCTSGDFPIFLACGQICFDFESATVKRDKKKRKNEGKERLWQRQRENISLIFAGLRLWRRKSTIVYTWCEEFFHAVDVAGSCVVRFACAR